MRFSFFACLVIFFFACSPEKKYSPVNRVEDILDNLAPAAQKENIDPAVDNIVKGDKGTRVFIPANCFRLADGSLPSGKISIELIEYYSNGDLFSRQLSTRSNGELLETGGMIYINATSGGQPLLIAGNQSIAVAFPNKNNSKSMETFYGKEDSTGMVSWQPMLSIGETGPLDPTIASDSTLYKLQMQVCGETVSCNDFKADYRLYHPDSTLALYMTRHLQMSDADLLNFYNTVGSTSVKMRLKEGRVTEIFFDSSSLPVRYKGIFQKFFRELPRFYMDNTDACGMEWNNGVYIDMCAYKSFDAERYARIFKEKYDQYRQKAIAAIDPEELNCYIISSSKLGWINCDRFYNSSEEKTDYMVKVPQVRNTKMQLVFTDIRSIMQGEVVEGGFVFRNVPLNRKVKLMAVAFIDRKPMLGTADVTVSNKPYQLQQFKEFSLSDLEEEMKKL